MPIHDINNTRFYVPPEIIFELYIMYYYWRCFLMFFSFFEVSIFNILRSRKSKSIIGAIFWEFAVTFCV